MRCQHILFWSVFSRNTLVLDAEPGHFSRLGHRLIHSMSNCAKPCPSAKTPLRLKVRPHAMSFPSKPCSLKWSSPVVSSIDRSSLKHPGAMAAQSLIQQISGKDQCTILWSVRSWSVFWIQNTCGIHGNSKALHRSRGNRTSTRRKSAECSTHSVPWETQKMTIHHAWNLMHIVQHGPKAVKRIKVQQSYVVGKRARDTLNCKNLEILSGTLCWHLLIRADSSACYFCDMWPTFSLSLFTVPFDMYVVVTFFEGWAIAENP